MSCGLYRLLLILSCSAYFNNLAYAQTPEIHETVEVNLINIELSAVDKAGRFITDLRKDELIITENGMPQQIASFSNAENAETPIPLQIGFVIDKSPSMGLGDGQTTRLKVAEDALRTIVASLNGQDSLFLVTFDDDGEPRLSGPYPQKEEFSTLISSFKTNKYGATPLFDAVAFTLDKLNEQMGRKVLVVCSDAQDNASKLLFDDLLLKVQKLRDFQIFAIGTVAFARPPTTPQFGGPENITRGKEILKQLATAAGGVAFFPSETKDLPKLNQTLDQTISTSYSLAYRSTNIRKDGLWRAIEIRCTRPGIKLRYRDGYFADQESSFRR